MDKKTISDVSVQGKRVLVVEDGRQGWILQDLLQMATPEPNW